jgi:hypothetical protein
MGYDLHITRKACWVDDDGPTITLDEWKALVMSDPEMSLDGFHVGVAGDIVVKNPDKEIRVKMYQIAQKLGAKVQGDERELYDIKGNVVRSSVPRTKNRWGFLLVSILILILAVGVFVILGLRGTFFVLILSTLVFLVLRLIVSK